ncbi:MAG: hypothetical protein MRECE_63c002 [Mycoplasmataceae bacterium CE_OT135]|nr:MAG: hypothetical protein MRECE_63c002 [Mycoplasmataceae bacterium CE_OT135]
MLCFESHSPDCNWSKTFCSFLCSLWIMSKKSTGVWRFLLISKMFFNLSLVRINFRLGLFCWVVAILPSSNFVAGRKPAGSIGT